MRSLVQRLTSRRAPARWNARLSFDALEDRLTPATVVAPDLLTQYDSGVSTFDNITRNTQPLFAGTTTSPAGTVLALVIDDVTVGATTSAHGGGAAFRIRPTQPLGDGVHTARFYDSSTRALSNALTFTIDSAAPVSPIAPTLVDLSDLSNAVIQVQGSAGSRLRLFVDGESIVVIPASGDEQSLTVDLTRVLDNPNQTFAIWATQEDAAGNRSAASNPRTVSLTEFGPPPPTDLHLDVDSDTGYYDDDRITQAATLTFSGTGAPGQEMTLFLDGIQAARQTVDADGTFSFTVGPLNEGSHDAKVSASEHGVFGPASDVVTVRIDNTPPALSNVTLDSASLSPNGDDVLDSTVLRFTLSEPAEITAYFVDHDNVTLGSSPLGLLDVGDQEFDLAVPQFQEGSYTIYLLAFDLADNVGDIAWVDFSIDMTPPTVPSFALAAGQDTGRSATDGVTTATTPQFVGVAEPGATISLFDGDTLLGMTTAETDGSWTIAAALSEGPHTLVVFASDQAGNAASSDPFAINVDTTPPIIDAGDDVVADEGSPVTLTVPNADEAGVVYSWELVSASSGQAVASVTGSSLTFTPADAGTYVFRAVAVDAAGNTSDDAVTVVVNEVAPTIHAGWPSSVAVGTPFVVNLGVTDPGHDPLDHWTIAWGDGTHETLPGSATSASHTYTLSGTYVPVIQATQGDATWNAGGANTSVVVNRNNSAPSMVGGNLTYDVLTGTTLAVSATDVASKFADANGDPLTFALAAAPSVGTVTMDANGAFRYVPPSGYEGTVTFSVRAFDGELWSTPLSITIQVRGPYGLRR